MTTRGGLGALYINGETVRTGGVGVLIGAGVSVRSVVSQGCRPVGPPLVVTKVVPEVTPFYDIPAIPEYPYDGSALVIWDSGNPAPPTGNLAPDVITSEDPEWADLLTCAKSFGSDPHECPRRQPSARLQKSEFLKTGGMVVDVCAGAACLAPAD